MPFDWNGKSNNPILAFGFLVAFCFIPYTASNFNIPLLATYASNLVRSKMQIKCFKLSSIFLGICGSMILPHKVSYNLKLFLNLFLFASNCRFGIHSMQTKHP